MITCNPDDLMHCKDVIVITIGIVSQKGGAGKTTLAIHLAAVATQAGQVACLIDTDPQATAAAWGDWRKGADPEVITCPPVRLEKTLADAAKLGATIAIVDTPPHADAAARETARLADLILIPCRPRAFDLHAISTTADLIRQTAKKAFVVFNATPTKARLLHAEAQEVIEGLGLKIAPITIADRAAYHANAANGKTALESDPKGKASQEIRNLWEWVASEVPPLSAQPPSQKLEGVA